MTWIVSSLIENPIGLCLNADTGWESIDYKPYFRFVHVKRYNYMDFTIYPGVYRNGHDHISPRYTLLISFQDAMRDYIRRTYSLPEDTEVGVTMPGSNVVEDRRGEDREFDTEAEALEFANNIDDPATLGEAEDGATLFTAAFAQVINGVLVQRNVDIRHSGETVKWYTIDDVLNYWATVLGTSRDGFDLSYTYTFPEPDDGFLRDEEALPYWPESGCTPRTIVNIVSTEGGPGSVITIDPDFTPQTLDPDNITVTIVDGDPPSTSLENGAGSITISDAGNITMLNDGGTFFLNEFGNVGFYTCLLYTSPSPRDRQKSRMPSSA